MDEHNRTFCNRLDDHGGGCFCIQVVFLSCEEERSLCRFLPSRLLRPTVGCLDFALPLLLDLEDLLSQVPESVQLAEESHLGPVKQTGNTKTDCFCCAVCNAPQFSG